MGAGPVHLRPLAAHLIGSAPAVACTTEEVQVLTSALLRSSVMSGDPGITPNEDGLPGLPVIRSIVGALLTWGLVACVAGLVISVIVWALAHQQGNYQYAQGGKSGVVVSAGGALLIGAANAIVGFFAGLGAGV